ncbi:DUF3426 domain-containing protein [Gilvimarinus xylanilyticus]|uniref:Zinc-ribbon domain-containing protein n=1 Tax=Gilvimarinus xylanilyticus TaxID=2944139 RepID=A0A9X2HT19_9GAMM|nr:DUF3426 domain-containing protein [Gilvimarinus xylanilyticus]MCP8897745.1 zinc-ribbon domain-containing protein [Gilvimarinus xylanilyticus]
MANMVTRCPQCKTSFRITPTQIQKAKGAVRCGSCLHIFDAEKHLVEGARAKPAKPKTPAAKPQAAPAPVKPAPPEPTQTSLAIDAEPPQDSPDKDTSAKESSGKLQFDQAQIDQESELDDDILISDHMDSDTDEADTSLFSRDFPEHSLFERAPARRQEEFVDDSDESWAENLLDEDQDPSPVTHYDDPLSIIHEPEADQIEPSEADVSTPFDDELANQTPPESAPGDITLPEPDEQPTAPTFSFADSEPEPDDSEEGFYKEERMHAYDSERSALLMGIDPVPVEMTGAGSGQWRSRALWSGLSLLALVLLVVQIAWLQFDRLSRSQPYRDYYQSACNLLGCELPAMADKSKIRAYNLVVRNHPEQSNALVVDAIIVNNAAFSQTFPQLQLTFTDTRDKVVASRQFTPAEYLRGELAGSQTMPRKQPVHLSLELADPGPSAVNYRLEIR